MNHRWGARRALDARVRLLASHAMIGTGHIRDLSVTGAFIETRLELHALSLLYLQPAASPLATSFICKRYTSSARSESVRLTFIVSRATSTAK